MASRGVRLGFFDGVAALFRGAGFVIGTPSVWGWAAIPAVVAALLFVGLGGLAVFGADALAQHLIDATPGTSAWAAVGLWTMRILFAVIAVVIAFFLAATLAQPLSGFALDVIARRQAQALGANGNASPAPGTRAAAFARSLRVTLSSLAVALPILGLLALVTLLFPPASVVTVPLKFLVVGLTVAYDFLDYPLSLRGEGVRARFAFVRRHFGAVLGLGAASAVLLLVPGIGLFLLPCGVAGATRLVAAADRDGRNLLRGVGSCDDGSP